MVDTLHPASSATDSAVRSCSPALVKISSCFMPQGYTCSVLDRLRGSAALRTGPDHSGNRSPARGQGRAITGAPGDSCSPEVLVGWGWADVGQVAGPPVGCDGPLRGCQS